MAIYGWEINLSGTSKSVYSVGAKKGKKTGTITANECFAEGTAFGAGWEGWGNPVIFLNASHSIVQGAVENTDGFVNFSEYASNGKTWEKVNTLKRKVVSDTVAYYADGSQFKRLPAGSYVWLSKSCTRGQKNPNFIAVTKIMPKNDKEYSFKGNGFINLVPSGKWLNVASIILRKA